MNCAEVRRHWNLYHDSEGDASLHFQVNEHLASCSACAEWFAQQSRLENVLTRHLALKHSDSHLWHSVLVQAGVIAPSVRIRFASPLLLVACLAAVLVLAVTVGSLRLIRSATEQPSLSAQAASWQARLVGGDAPIPFHSESDLEVEDYLRQQVSFPVRCPPRKDAGFAVEGAGTCELGGEHAAYLVGKVEGERATIFILSRDSLAAFPHQQAALRSESVHRCREGKYEMALSVVDRNLLVVIGQAHGDELLRVLRAYGTYPHESSG